MPTDPQVWLWLVARAGGLAAYAAICISVISGVALRTGALDIVAVRRALRALHDFTVWIWIPLGLAHVLALLVDGTARIGLLDAVVPFRTPYGPLAIGSGTLSLDLVILVVLTSWYRRHLSVVLWRNVHRLSYAAFALAFVHAVLSGTDVATPVCSALAWAAAAAVATQALARVPWRRLAQDVWGSEARPFGG